MSRSTNLFSRNYPTYFAFDQEEKISRCLSLNSYFIKLTKAAPSGVPWKRLCLKFSQLSLLGQGWYNVAGHKACNLIKKRLQHSCFPVNIAKFLIISVLEDIYIRLPLKLIIKNDFLEKPLVTMIITWWIWVVKDQRLVVVDRGPALSCSPDGYIVPLSVDHRVTVRDLLLTSRFPEILDIH